MAIFGNTGCALVAVTDNQDLGQQWERSFKDLCEILQASDLQTMRNYVEEYRPSLLLLDRDLPGLTILKEIGELLKISPSTKIVVFTTTFEEEEAISVIKAGAKGYEQKNSDVLLLRKSIEVIQKGELWIPRYLITRLLNEVQVMIDKERELTSTLARSGGTAGSSASVAKLDQLTRREQQIAELIANGYSNKEIGGLLKISESTVKAHLSAIYHKLGLLDRLSLALFITHQNRLQPEPAEIES